MLELGSIAARRVFVHGHYSVLIEAVRRFTARATCGRNTEI